MNNRRARSWTAVLLFVLLFGGLLVTATFTDLQVSQILTKNVLANHSYYTNNAFGTLFESVGSGPVYFMLAFSFQILALYGARVASKKWQKYLSVGLCPIFSTIAYYVFFNDTIGYMLEHLNAEEFEGAAFLKSIAFFMAIVLNAFALLAVNNFSDASLKKLVRFAWAMLLTALVANALIAIVKEPVGRMRFRAMNTAGGMSIGGFDNFTRWYVVNGQMEKAQMLELFGTTDACKSFPSGHTCAAGMSYGLIMLIPALGITDKKKKAALWVLPILFTGTVAISRIMVGAHFFSDVLMGGTIAFVCMILFREIFLCDNQNIKAMFGKF